MKHSCNIWVYFRNREIVYICYIPISYKRVCTDTDTCPSEARARLTAFLDWGFWPHFSICSHMLHLWCKCPSCTHLDLRTGNFQKYSFCIYLLTGILLSFIAITCISDRLAQKPLDHLLLLWSQLLSCPSSPQALGQSPVVTLWYHQGHWWWEHKAAGLF